jgi:demethylmenaquinone methyltransferase / 2-methoxy-6-polyprenyl-1,4-benzoquinol methylase
MATNNNASPSGPLHVIFTAIPSRYDFINHIITLGMDGGWRRRAVAACLKGNPSKILDPGCGTGDLTINLAKKAKGPVEITGLDFSLPMLKIAREKAARHRLEQKVRFVHGEVAKIPFPDGYFDCVGISFAFRNITYKNPLAVSHLEEIRRVIKTSGRLVVVESSQPENSLIRMFFRGYLRAWVYPVSVLLSGNRSAYRYLAESAALFYSPPEVKEMLLKSGFRSVSYRPLFFGAAGIHIATV